MNGDSLEIETEERKQLLKFSPLALVSVFSMFLFLW